jgi:hypothetical protein
MGTWFHATDINVSIRVLPTFVKVNRSQDGNWRYIAISLIEARRVNECKRLWALKNSFLRQDAI